MPGSSRRAAPDDEDEEDLYDVLGVDRDASKSKITSAFRKLAMKHHPDRGGNEEKFKEIQRAYEILSDEEKRSVYDRYGMSGLKGGMSGGPGIDLFEEMFRGGGRSSRREEPKVAPLQKEIWISLQDVFRGSTYEIEVEYKKAEFGGTCKTCNGTGTVLKQVRHGIMIMQHQSACSRCEARGIVYRNRKNLAKKVRVHIPKGIQHNQEISLSGKGHELPVSRNNSTAGKLDLTFRVKHDQTFTRMGADLFMKKKITLLESLVGFVMEIPFVDGYTKLRYEDSGGIRHNQVVVFEGWGLPQFGGILGNMGNLIVQFEIMLPQNGAIDEACAKELKSICQNIKWANTKTKNSNETNPADFAPGVRVQLHSLLKYPNLNNKFGTLKYQTERGWAMLLDGNRKNLISVPDNKMRIIKDPKVKKRKTEAVRRFQEENNYEESVSGHFVKEADIKVTPAAAVGNAHDHEEEQRGGGQPDVCQQQ